MKKVICLLFLLIFSVVNSAERVPTIERRSAFRPILQDETLNRMSSRSSSPHTVRRNMEVPVFSRDMIFCAYFISHRYSEMNIEVLSGDTYEKLYKFYRQRYLPIAKSNFGENVRVTIEVKGKTVGCEDLIKKQDQPYVVVWK